MEPDPPVEQPSPQRRPLPTWARLALVLGLLYLFLVGVRLLEVGIKTFGEDTAQRLFEGVANPVAALFVGILATVMVQSSSVTTSTIVGLVAAGVLPIDTAVPMIMGANIGTTITNTIVALAHVRRSEEFRRAFVGATMHDFFNLLAVAVLFPLELLTGVLSRTASTIAHLLAGSGVGGTFNSPIKAQVKAGAAFIESLVERLIGHPAFLAAVLLLVGIVLIFATLTFITKNMKVLVADRIERSMNAALSRSGSIGMLVGLVVTIAVQSSSITTSILIPIIASGLLLARNAYPITLGANVGTTVTALIAALGAGKVDGLTIAFVHLLFNLGGILILYVPRPARDLPIRLAEALAGVAIRRKSLAIAYVVGTFIVVPAMGIFLLS